VRRGDVTLALSPTRWIAAQPEGDRSVIYPPDPSISGEGANRSHFVLVCIIQPVML
jgi:hypothetical protein